jgi:hypothetical protein
MLLPGVLIKRSRSRGRDAGAMRGGGAVERAVYPVVVVVIAERRQLSHQVDSIPKEHPIEIFAANGADQPFDERMRSWDVRNRLNLLDLDYAQVGEPSMKAKQRIVVCADVFRWRLARNSVVLRIYSIPGAVTG